MIASFTCIDISLDFVLIAPVKQLPNTSSTPEINSRYFIYFIHFKVTREQATLGHETACQSFVQILHSPWKCRYSGKKIADIWGHIFVKLWITSITSWLFYSKYIEGLYKGKMIKTVSLSKYFVTQLYVIINKINHVVAAKSRYE